MNTADVRALDAAINRGAKAKPAPVIEQPAPPPPPIDEHALTGMARVLSAIAEHKSATLDLQPLTLRLQALLDKADPAVDPALLAALGELSIGLTVQAQRTDAQLGQILAAVLGLAQGQQDIVATLNAPVIPQYDDHGRVVGAQRQPLRKAAARRTSVTL